MKMMKYIGLIVAVALFASCGNKLAYIDTNKVMDEYHGMVEARTAYQVKVDGWSAQIDSTQRKFQHELAAYQANISKMSVKERGENEAFLQQLQQEGVQFQKGIQEQAQIEEKKVTEAVIEAMNAQIEVYAKDKGYDFILGANGSGSLLYANDEKEITAEILEYLNK